jgi:GTP-binding protein EngB required for normal cell division
MLYDYLKISTRLVRIYLLINIEHGIKDIDRHLLEKI